MNKVSLIQAKQILAGLRLVDIYASSVTNKLDEDIKTLDTIKQIKHKIYKAEKHFNIDDMYHQIDLLKLEVSYFDPFNHLFYYKEKISDELNEEADATHKDLIKSINTLQDKIEELSEHIYIEV